MLWQGITLTSVAANHDLMSGLLFGIGADGVEENQTPSGELAITAYFAEDEPLAERLAQLNQRLAVLTAQALITSDCVVTTSVRDDADWQNTWKAYYHAERLTRRLTVVPAWEDYHRQQADEQLIVLDPESSFGTGTHPTTRLALQAMEAILRGGETVLDLGTGSGVLAIAAYQLGVAHVIGTDIDAEAVAVAQANQQLNSVAQSCELIVSDGFATVPQQKFDVIIANILPDVLARLVPQMADYLAPNGQVILSGMLNERAAALATLAAAHGLVVTQHLDQQGWTGLVLVHAD